MLVVVAIVAVATVAVVDGDGGRRRAPADDAHDLDRGADEL